MAHDGDQSSFAHPAAYGNIVGFSLSALRAWTRTLATEYIVDDDGGVGVDFLDIPDALAVAVNKDVVTVRAGTYTGFTLSDGVILIGEAGARVDNGSLVTAVPAGRTAFITDLQLDDLHIQQNDGAVVLDGVLLDGSCGDRILRINDSPDVRLHRTRVLGCTYTYGGSTFPAVIADNSRLEFVDCMVRGDTGANEGCGDAGNGRQALITSLGRTHIVHSELVGGAGGEQQASPCYSFCGGYGGDGAPGLTLYSGIAIAAGGSLDTITGGDYGYGPAGSFYYCLGDCAPGVVVGSASATFRESGVTVSGGDDGYGGVCSAIDNQGGVVEQPAIPDPTLELVGDPAAGAQLRFVVRGEPGGAARLFFGRRPIVQDTGGLIERLLPSIRAFDLGNLPPSGEKTRIINLPSNLLRGTTFFAQASVNSAAFGARTNSVPIVIR